MYIKYYFFKKKEAQFLNCLDLQMYVKQISAYG